MTTEQLIEELSKYPKDAEVHLACTVSLFRGSSEMDVDMEVDDVSFSPPNRVYSSGVVYIGG